MEVLTAIEQRNKSLLMTQTMDIEEKTIRYLLDDLNFQKSNWKAVLSECKTVANKMNIDPIIALFLTSTRVHCLTENGDETEDNIEPGIEKIKKIISRYC